MTMLLLALLVTVLFGGSVWLLLAGWPRQRAGWWLALGEGYLLGTLLIGNLLWIGGALSTEGLFLRSLPWLLGAAMVAVALARWRRLPAAPLTEPADSAVARRLVALGLLLLAALWLVILVQAWTLPTLTWDAWNAWLAKAKAWHHAGAMLPVVDLPVWLAGAPEPLLSAVAAPYPEALPRYATWLASAAGRWRDGDVQLAWPLLWLALGAILAGALRLRGVARLPTLAAVGFLLTLPIVTAHASLAGYADLWLAAAVLASGHHAARFIAGERRAIVPALVFALLLPTIKLEGAVWMLMLLAGIGLWLLPSRWRWLAPAGVVVALSLSLLLLPGFGLPVPGLGRVVLEWGAITVPVVGHLELFWRDVGGTVAESLLLLPNWSLLFYLLLPLIVWRWRRIGEPANAMLAAVLLLGAAFLFVLFFFTDASRWAENLTSLNRLVLHLVPLLVCWLALLLLPPRPAVRGRWA
jgi:hypothetical protein